MAQWLGLDLINPSTWDPLVRDPEKPQPLAKVVRYLNELAASPEGTPSP
ncbi:MAG: hypothetical protein H7333_05020 [Bdellovibrionales bacterium]|nr:hypothetical protein [Oligoflexia bacterium]